ncbi:MAG: hypothetical protein IJZ85_09000 [Lachnospiraceae bacterium]|nr:hypothetical protein [Lachnospiraceae bacterium]
MSTNDKKILSEEQRQELLAKIQELKSEMADIEEYIAHSYEELVEDETIDPQEMYFSSPEGQLDILSQERQGLEEKLFEDDYWRKNVEYTELYKKKILDYSVGNMLSDIECDISQDVFKRKTIAKTIAETLCKSENQGPFNIGVLGKWGQGKTTFIKYVKESISQNENASRIRVIDYNASEYDEQEKIWANLANRLFKEYEKNTWFSKIKYYISKVKRDSKIYKEKVLFNILIIVGIFMLTVISKELFSIKNIVGYFAGASAGLSAGVIAISKIVIPFFQSAISSSIPLSDKIIDKLKLPSYVDVLGKREEISADLAVLFDVWLKNENDKVVIFVDELDRCTEKGIVEFFQSIQLLISNKKLCFVFAIDAGCLKNAFKKYNGISEGVIEEYLNLFLDKYVSVIVPLNEVIDYSKYIESIVSHTKPAEEKYCFSQSEIDTINKCINTISSELLTPRKVKKIINILILLKEYCVNNINKEYAIKFEELLTWYIFAFVYREEAKVVLAMYNDKRKYAPLKTVMNRSNAKTIEENPRCKKYVSYMKDYAMSDLNLYNYISLFFMPEVSYS